MSLVLLNFRRNMGYDDQIILIINMNLSIFIVYKNGSCIKNIRFNIISNLNFCRFVLSIIICILFILTTEN